ncbi:MAG: GNAT family N-acetyltransferase [Muribaculaceae bacterium]|nr:GNAT family N-acetyltransferase [Muribaculaceae bacterium]MDE5968308.1 GNAT family N-acetyltransferase [Muribaculaceae bacterium]
METATGEITLKPFRSGDCRQILDLYERAFPADERRPIGEFCDLVATDTVSLRAIFVDNLFAGFITMWHFGKFSYIEHFALDPEQRGRGIGSRVLGMLSGLLARPVVLEAEPPSLSPLAARRIEFYHRNGFDIISTDYVQPPYGPGLNPVNLYLLATEPLNADEVASELKKQVYKI